MSTSSQDAALELDALVNAGVQKREVLADVTSGSRTAIECPGMKKLLECVEAGDTLVVTKLDRLARSLPDARDIVEDLTKRKIKLSLGGNVHDPTDPVGRLLFNVLAMVAEFESDLIRARTREGMQIAKAKGRLRGRQPKLSPAQEKHLVALHHGGKHTSAEIAELFGVARSTVYRIVQRSGGATEVLGNVVRSAAKEGN